MSDQECRIIALHAKGVDTPTIATELSVATTDVERVLAEHLIDGGTTSGADGERKLLELIARTVPDIIYIFDLNRAEYSYVNRQFRVLLGSAPKSNSIATLSFFRRIVHPEDWPAVVQYYTGLRESRQIADTSCEFRVRHLDGTYRWLRTKDIICERDEDGVPTLISGIATDISAQRAAAQDAALQRDDEIRRLSLRQEQLERANAFLARHASSDGLTGLTNHRMFQETLESEIERSYALRCPVSVVLLDIDHFKTYNDEFGHPAGDELLRQLSRLMVDVARDADVVARYGGEEFAIILIETPMEGCNGFARRLQHAIANTSWPRRPITVSMGCATWHHGESREELLERADSALYSSKHQGRNCFAVADSPWAEWRKDAA